MSIETDIEQALINRIKNLAILPDVQYPGRAITPIADRRWLDIINFRNTEQNQTWGDNERSLLGIFQITVHDPLQLGNIPVLVICSQIRDWFAKGTLISFGSAVIKIDQNPSILSAIETGQETQIPISIPYRCDNF